MGLSAGDRTAEGGVLTVASPRRVLLVVHQFFPHTRYGTERYTLELAHGLRSLGSEVTVLTVLPRDVSPDDGARVSRYTWEGVPVLALDGSLAVPARFEDTFASLGFRELWQEVLWELKPDVVHACHLLNHTPEFLAVARESGVPLVLTLTDFWGICWGGVLVRGADGRECSGPGRFAGNCVADWAETHGATTSPRLNAALDRLRGTPLYDVMANAPRILPRLLRRRLSPEIDGIVQRGRRIRERYDLADAWIAPSHHLLDRYVQAGYPRERLQRIPYGIAGPTEDEREALDARFVRTRPEDAPLRIGYLGQIAPHKGVHQLIDAFRKAGLRSATLAIHGDPDLIPDYGRQLRLDADPRIKFCGVYASNDVYRILAGIDVMVIPSLWHENAPLVLLSALASGTPVVISNAEGMLEFVRSGKDALTYPIGDTGALAAQLARLENEPTLLRELVANHKPYAFSGLDCARATLDVYEAAAAGRQAPRFERPLDRIEPTFQRLAEHETPACSHANVLGALVQAEARSLEVWVPRAARTPNAGAAPRSSSLRAAARAAMRRVGSLRGGLRLAYHSRPCFSLWSFRRAGSLDFTRHPDFSVASRLEIVAGHNRGSQSRLRYRVEGEPVEAVHEAKLTWPKGAWSRLQVPLVTVGGRRLASLVWQPTVADGRSPLKLDLLEVQLLAEDEAAQTSPAP